MPRTLASGLTLTGLLALTACTSIRSRLYDSDGSTSDRRQVKRLKGVPITVEVPTHVRVAIEETRYLRDVTKNEEAPQPMPVPAPTQPPADKKDSARRNAEGVAMASGTATEPGATASPAKKSPVTTLPPTYSMKYDLVCKKQVYAVDFKRPLVGTNDLKLKFAPSSTRGQYFDTINQDVTDTSLTSVAKLVESVSAIVPGLRLGAVGKPGENPNPGTGLASVTGVIAVEYFDIHQPNLEAAIQAFLDRNMNARSGRCAPGNVIETVPPVLISQSPKP